MLFYRCYGRDIFSVYFFVINSFVRGRGGYFFLLNRMIQIPLQDFRRIFHFLALLIMKNLYAAIEVVGQQQIPWGNDNQRNKNTSKCECNSKGGAGSRRGL